MGLGENEKSSLLKNSHGARYGGIGDGRNQKSGDVSEIKKISIFKLFKYATTSDKWILAIGTIFSFVHGAGMPLLALVFGSMTNTFIKQALFGFKKDNITTSLEPVEDGVGTTESIQPTGNRSNSLFMNVTSDQGQLSREEFSEYIASFSLYYVYIGLLVFVASLIQAVCWEWSCERQTYRLRQEFFYQALRQETAWYDNHQTGDLALKLSDDLERIREGIGHKFSMVIQYWASFLSGFVVGFVTSWQLTLVILSLTPLLAGTSAFVGRLIATQSAREQQKYGKAGAVAEEVLSCIKTVASFGGERREINRYEQTLMAALRLAIRKYYVMAAGMALVFFVMHTSYGFSFWYGCQLLLDELITPGDIFTVFFSVLVGAFALGNAVPYIATIGIAQGSGAVVFEIIDSIPEIDPYSNNGRIPDEIIGRIEFRNVHFRYPSRKEIPILMNFTMDIQPGKTVAVVGSSGAGKSTIINMILRFYDPESGVILVDGSDIKGLNLAWLRSHIGVVSQEPILFDTTIYENIRYGREDVSPEEVVAAARLANAHDFVSSLPAGYETLTGDRGAQLSGGQKQRIAIARALARNPRILLLDEATSALDAKSESEVQAALDKARQGRTTIIVAHRLSSIKDADLIYALKDGVVVETGNHNQLMAKEEFYFDLVTSQTSMDVVDELAGDASASYDSWEDNPKASYEYERRLKRRIHRGRKKFRSTPLPDPDKSRLLRETTELDAKYPGIWKILKVNKPEWLMLLGGFFACLICGAVMPVFAFFYSEMFATFSLRGQDLVDASVFWALMFVVLAVVSGFGFWSRTILIASSGEYLTMRLRLMSYTQIVRQPLAWFDKDTNSPGRLATRLARDAPMVKAAAGHRLATFISAITTIVTGLGIAFFFGWQLALAILVGFPVLVVAGYIQVQIQKDCQRKDAELMEDAGRVATEAIQNIKTVQSFSIERLFYEKYLEHLQPVYFESHKQAIIYGSAFAFSEAVIFFIYAGAFYYGAYLIGVGVMDPATVYRVFFCVAFSAVSVGQATSFIPDYTKANLATGLIFNLIETNSKIDPFSPDGLRPILNGRVIFSNVQFRYPNRIEFPVLQGLSFDLQPGITLALVGPSGCGKSTVVSLLERFYDVTGGQIMIDGFDIRTLNVAHLRQMIGLVTQEPVLFDCTIRDNIAYGYGDGTCHVPDDLIIEAAMAANIHNFITSLPLRYETFVGERGTQLSGGQKQRIAIARALVRNPRILLLDEATSALDMESEKIVQEALDKARTGRTCIIIAHRLSTIQSADVIAVVNSGRIVEMGSHDQLIKARKMYYKLTKKQQITH